MDKKEILNRIEKLIGDEEAYAFISKGLGEKYFRDFSYLFNLCYKDVIYADDIQSKNIDSSNKIIVFGNDFDEAKKLLLQEKDISDNSIIDINDILLLFDIDPVRLAKGKKVAIWGAGSLSTFLHIYSKTKDIGLNPECYFDSDCEKHGKCYDGLFIKDYYSLGVEERKDYFIIVCSAYYKEIAEALQNEGLKENVNFISYISVVRNAIYMMKKTLEAPRVNGPYCPLPFQMANIHREGVYVCPPDWIDQLTIGSTIQDDLNEVWNSIYADIFRLSIENGTYSFCNLELCGLMKDKPHVIDEGEYSYEQYNKEEVPSMLILSHDHSCNLWCGSCRKCIQVAQGEEYKYAEKISQQLQKSGWLDKSDKLLAAGDGEVFCSRIYHDIVFNPDRTRKSISILSNGNLLVESVMKKLSMIYEHIDVEISIDAACKETYLTVRRGGNWERLYDNLKMIGEYRKKGFVRYFGIRMVVQSLNISEMPDFVELGKNINADLVRFARVRNFGSYTPEEFKNISIMTEENSQGKIKPEYEEILKNPILKDPIVGLYDMEKLIDDNSSNPLIDLSYKFDNLIYL